MTSNTDYANKIWNPQRKRKCRLTQSFWEMHHLQEGGSQPHVGGGGGRGTAFDEKRNVFREENRKFSVSLFKPKWWWGGARLQFCIHNNNIFKKFNVRMLLFLRVITLSSDDTSYRLPVEVTESQGAASRYFIS